MCVKLNGYSIFEYSIQWCNFRIWTPCKKVILAHLVQGLRGVLCAVRCP